MTNEVGSIQTVHATAAGFRATWTLVHKTAGYEVAGSGTRHTNEGWGAIATSKQTGATYGQWYKTESEAREHFERVTTPIVEQA